MNIQFWKFWTIAVLIVFALVTGYYYFGLLEFILTNDRTMITFVNLGILGLGHILIGLQYYKKDYQATKFIHNLSDNAVALGLIGTLIGFMLVLMSVFGAGVVLDPTDTVSMTAALTKMASGMGSAIITSLSGLITMLLLNLQIVILEK